VCSAVRTNKSVPRRCCRYSHPWQSILRATTGEKALQEDCSATRENGDGQPYAEEATRRLCAGTIQGFTRSARGLHVPFMAKPVRKIFAM
jgi:hypothetical protein